MKQITHSILLILLAILSTASINAANVTGKVCDETGEPLSNAGVRILSARDSSFVKGIPADMNGNFNISLKNGKYITHISYMGYEDFYKEITVSGNLAMGTIKLRPASVLLNDATVVGIRTPIKVMEDTVEYTADTYKTQPNAVVEDLLKRLPGVEVGSDGSITANGRSVTKILVDGQEFFSDDPKVASKIFRSI